METVNLKQHPEHLAEIAQWHFDEWGKFYPDSDLKEFRQDLEESLSDSDIPQTWILREGQQVYGSASILAQDMTINTDLSPWLANIYIRESKRGQGLGFKFVRDVLQDAKARGLGRLYLFTEDQRRFYQRLGWQVLKQDIYQGKTVDIMTINLQEL